MSSGYRTVLSRNLASLRRQTGYAQAQLAERIGVSTEFVSRLERGVAFPSLETLEALCCVLNCTPNDLLLDAAGNADYENLRSLFRRASPSAVREATRVAEAVLGYHGVRSTTKPKKKK